MKIENCLFIIRLPRGGFSPDWVGKFHTPSRTPDHHFKQKKTEPKEGNLMAPKDHPEALVPLPMCIFLYPSQTVRSQRDIHSSAKRRGCSGLKPIPSDHYTLCKTMVPSQTARLKRDPLLH